MREHPPYSEAFQRSESLGAGTGAAAIVTVGVGMAAAQLSGQLVHQPVAIVLAWVAYLAYLAVFCLDAFLPRRRWSPHLVVGTLTVCGLAVHLLLPGYEWTAVLFVVTAASLAFELTQSQVAGVVVLQTIAVGLSQALGGDTVFAIALISVLYLAFQVFAVLLVRSAQREAEARSELAATNAELRAATALLDASSRNAERLRIARDLHDVVGHQLTALALELEVAQHKADGETLVHVERARSNAKDLLADIRGVVSELRDGPGNLDAAVRPVLSGLPGLAVSLEIEEEQPVDDARALVVARILQEVSTNTLRHASAASLSVRVTSDDSGVAVDARDDGSGAARWQHGNGLKGMEERVAQLGGRITFDTAPGQGFQVSAWLPNA